MQKRSYVIGLSLLLMAAACNNSSTNSNASSMATDTAFSKGTFGYDLQFLHRQDSNLVVLKNQQGNAQVIVSPAYQAKVFTSTADNTEGLSFGWVNYEAFAGPKDAHMNAYGGENRFWLGPEGGIYSLYFKPKAEMVFDNWHTPAAFDSEAWTVSDQNAGESVTMTKDMQLTNYNGSDLSIGVSRKITLLDHPAIEQALGIALGDSVKVVGYSTDNTITNTGDFAWTEKTGMPCIWILDMFTPAPKTVMVLPFHPPTNKADKVATTDYFGPIPADRIKITDSVLYFKADGKSRGKLGLGPRRTKGVSGSYDPVNQVLTLLTFDVDPDGKYLYQKWDTAGEPFVGDAQNAYNDGPLEDGSQMGPFYEMESVSPAAFLQPGAALSHNQKVYHLTGAPATLDAIAEQVLGVSLQQIVSAFP